jgi:hypothetical protein
VPESQFPIFPAAWRGWRRRLWEILPVRVRSAWNPYDNWLRGYSAGMDAGLYRAEARQERGERIR